jgi:hypothetical protein
MRPRNASELLYGKRPIKGLGPKHAKVQEVGLFEFVDALERYQADVPGLDYHTDWSDGQLYWVALTLGEEELQVNDAWKEGTVSKSRWHLDVEAIEGFGDNTLEATGTLIGLLKEAPQSPLLNLLAAEKPFDD